MPKVLVVDDQILLDAVALQLSGSCQVLSTTNPEQALALALEHKPDAILLDLLMPNFSGFEVCQSLHALSYTSRIPILVMSGDSGSKYAEYCTKLGAKAYIQKPFDAATLKAALKAQIEKKPAEQRADVRLRLQVPLELRGVDLDGKPVVTKAVTENVSAGGFLCQMHRAASAWRRRGGFSGRRNRALCRCRPRCSPRVPGYPISLVWVSVQARDIRMASESRLNHSKRENQ